MDNTQHAATYPVVLAVPAPPTRLRLEMALPAASSVRSAALCMRVAVWARRPAGVLCIERIEVSMSADIGHLPWLAWQ